METWVPLMKQASLLLAFVTFSTILWWTLAKGNRSIEQCKSLPLEDDHASRS
jgi:hypothetical protein